MTPADIDAIAVRARAEAEAVALRAKAEVDAVALRAMAESDAAAARARAELEAHALRMGAEADRDEAARILAETRHQVDQMLAEARTRIDARVTAAAAEPPAAARAAVRAATAPSEEPRRSAADQEALDRLQATRLHLHEAIERLAEMSEPVLDLTDGLPGSASHLADEGGLRRDPVVDDRPVRTIEAPDGDDPPDAPLAAADAVDAFVLAAIERASASGLGVGEPELWGGDNPSTRRRELRDGRDLL
jgi:hypothetical protein